MDRYHQVEQGEHLASIAKDYHFADYHTIYNHEKNKALRDKRPDPNILLPGDLVFIPDKPTKTEDGSTEKTHRFKLLGPKTVLRLIIKDEEGKPHANQSYILKVHHDENERAYKGTTNNVGLLRQEIPADTETAELALDRLGLYWSLKIGHLDPLQEQPEGEAVFAGVKARLTNLGFECGAAASLTDPEMQEAIKAFQLRYLNRNDPSGNLDKDTLDALSKEHGC